MKRKHIFRQIFGKPVSKCVTLFRLRCLPAPKTYKIIIYVLASAEKTQSKSKYRRFVMVLLAFLRERMFCCWCFIESSL